MSNETKPLNSLRSIIAACIICLFAVLIEGIVAGKEAIKYMNTLPDTDISMSIDIWFVVAVLYYIMCVVILYRLFSAPESKTKERSITLFLGMMLLNIVWNYAFFREQNLEHSFFILFFISVIVLSLLKLLWNFQRTSAVFLLFYFFWLVYDGLWLWKIKTHAF